MTSNLDKYRKDVEALVARGDELMLAAQAQFAPREFLDAVVKQTGRSLEDAKVYVKTLPEFHSAYQVWYSEAKAVIRQLLPDRLDDFVRHYEKPKSRKNINFENYRIEDALQGLRASFGGEKVAGTDAAVPHVRQQVNILAAVENRFASSLFEIRQLVAADLLDSELDSAEVLASNGFLRAAGAVAGVVLEKHLLGVCENHSIAIKKKDPSIGDLNDALKAAGVVDVPTWRFVQHLADIRNLADHNKKAEPTKDQITDMLAGVRKTTKMLF